MKVADKYEILEMVTGGRVSTFLARDRATQEPVVVYTFECAGTGAAELSTASIIARFCAVALGPPGIIVKAGFDELSSSAFITTKMPDPVVLKDWIRAYHSALSAPAPGAVAPGTPGKIDAVAPETSEIDPTEVKEAWEKSNRPSNQLPDSMGEGTSTFSIGSPVEGSRRSSEDLTRLFREAKAFQPLPAGVPLRSRDSEVADSIFGGPPKSGFPMPEKPAPPSSAPGAFTKEFLAISGETGDPARIDTPGSSSPPPQKEPGAFTKEFLAVSQPPGWANQGDDPPQPATPPAPFRGRYGPPSSSTPSSNDSGRESEIEKNGAGDFTSLFGNPFNQPGLPDRPIHLPDMEVAQSPKPQTGDFTSVFGREDIAPSQEDSASALEPEPRPAPAASFTQIFADGVFPKGGAQLGSSTLDTHPSLRPIPDPILPPSPPVRSPLPSMTLSPQPDFFSQPIPPPLPPAPSATDRPFQSRTSSSGATETLKTPGGEAPSVEEMPSGRSEFTMFVSRRELITSLPPESPATDSKGSAFAWPPKPVAPAPPPLAPPQPPAINSPVAAPPPAPQFAAPAVPKAASYWPLITVLTILIAIGAMLVMYFVIKR